MKSNIIKFTVFLAFAILLVAVSETQAQGIFGKIKEKTDKVKNDATKTDPTKNIPNKAGSTNSGTTTNNESKSGGGILDSVMPQNALMKPTLRVLTLRDQRYWKQPNLDNFWSWVPKVVFEVSGPVAVEDRFVVEFTKPDGKTWITTEERSGFSISANKTLEIEVGKLVREPNTPHDVRTSVETGTYGFKISMKPAQGEIKELYKGTFKVNKFFAGTNHPNFKNQYVFYVEQDWNLPIGYLWADAKDYPKAPVFNASMWFRGDIQSKLKGYLYYNGKQISSTETASTGVTDRIASSFSEGDDDDKAHWEHVKFVFYNVKSFNNTENAGETHQLSRNPGNYEIKVMYDGELIRTMNFTVGSDGKISDGGVAASSGFGGFRAVVPVKVISAKEGTLNLQNWKTDAFYGNPLSGFSVQ